MNKDIKARKTEKVIRVQDCFVRMGIPKNRDQ